MDLLRVVDEHQQPLFRFAYRLTGSAEDAEDVVQECFLELLRPNCGYDAGRTVLRTYLFGAVRNQALKRLRRRGEPLDGEASQSPSQEREILAGELDTAVEQAVKRLPETQRAVVILAHYEQLPLAEIAEVMELDIGAVKSRLQRGRAALKEMLTAWAPGVERKR